MKESTPLYKLLERLIAQAQMYSDARKVPGKEEWDYRVYVEAVPVSVLKAELEAL